MRYCLILSILLLLACSHSPERSIKPEKKIYSLDENSVGNDEITCWGIGEIDLDNDMSTLEEKADKKNMSVDSIVKDGVFEGFVTTLWKGTSKEIIVHWKEKTPPFHTIDFLEIRQEKSPYHFVNGIKLGTTLREMVKLNGRSPISLYGFGSAQAGTFASFGSGKLSGDIPCFGGVFDLPENRDSRQFKDGEKLLSSDPVLTRHETRLVSIQIHN